MDNKSPKIAVVGAGIVGLTVATMVQKEIPKAQTALIANAFQEQTTAYAGAGIFRPGTSFRGKTKEITKKWIDDSWYYWEDILKSSHASEAGLMSLDTYIFSKNNYNITKNHLIDNLVPIYRPVEFEELKCIHGGYKYGSYFSTLKIEPSRHMPWLANIFKRNGGITINQTINNLSSLSQFDLVFNCTGIGAKYLCKDDDLVPIKGQAIKVRAPWLTCALYGEYDTYMIPGFDGLATLGGVRHYDSYSMKSCYFDTMAILERCYSMVPQLRRAKIVNTVVGLRPHRVPVRVEGEIENGLKIVHCYGHGGYGIMSAPGTAMDAINIGIDLMKRNTKSHI